MIALFALIALLVGGGIGYLIHDSNNDTKTVTGSARTVTVPASTTNSVGVTVTQAERTVEQTVTVPVTVTATVQTLPPTTTTAP
jgi:hypothetical protein